MHFQTQRPRFNPKTIQHPLPFDKKFFLLACVIGVELRSVAAWAVGGSSRPNYVCAPPNVVGLKEFALNIQCKQKPCPLKMFFPLQTLKPVHVPD